MDVAQLVEPRVVVPVVVGSSPIVHPKCALTQRAKAMPFARFDEVMSAEIAGGDFGRFDKGR